MKAVTFDLKTGKETTRDFTQAEIDSLRPSPEQITAHISAYRRTKENGGVVIGGVSVSTDTESRSNLLGASQLGVSINWKTDNGFVELTNEQVIAIAVGVGQHVQKCFNAEKVVYELHDATPFTTKEAIETEFDDAYSN